LSSGGRRHEQLDSRSRHRATHGPSGAEGMSWSGWDLRSSAESVVGADAGLALLPTLDGERYQLVDQAGVR
jgi:hypothetical protein